MKASLPVLGAAKNKSGYNTRCKSYCSAMIGACAKWTALMNRTEINFRLWGRRKFDLLEKSNWTQKRDFEYEKKEVDIKSNALKVDIKAF